MLFTIPEELEFPSEVQFEKSVDVRNNAGVYTKDISLFVGRFQAASSLNVFTDRD